MICLLICSSTACISLHLLVVVPVVDTVSVIGLVEGDEPVKGVERVESTFPVVVEVLDNPV